MSRNKSQIGSTPAVKRQPPPMRHQAAFFTTPPIAPKTNTEAVAMLAWLRMPVEKPDTRSIARVRALRHLLHERLRGCSNHTTRSELWLQLEHVAQWLKRSSELHDADRRDEPRATEPDVEGCLGVDFAPAKPHAIVRPPTVREPEQRESLTTKRESAGTAGQPRPQLGTLNQLAARLEVRIRKLNSEQEALGNRLADPMVYASVDARTRLLDEYSANQEKLLELESRWEYARTEIDALASAPASEPDELHAPVGVLERLGLRIQALRKHHGLSSETLAKRIGSQPHVIDQLERGQRSISIETTIALARNLGVSASELLVNVDRPLPEADRLTTLLAGRPAQDQLEILRTVKIVLALSSASAAFV